MKFEKLSDTKLKITMSYEELPNAKDLDELMHNTDTAQGTFFKLLEKADEAVGFDTKDFKIKIDAQALYNGELIFIVTKLLKLNKKSKSVKPKRIPKENNEESTYSVYKFDTFEDFCSFCSYVNENKINYLNRLCKECILYKYKNNFYLSLKQINPNYPKLPSFYSSITEFSKYYTSKDLFIYTLNEHGELYMQNNALIKGQKYFA